MDDLDVLARDLGFGARGKSNPMRSDHRSTDDPFFSNVFAGQPKYAPSSNSNTSVKNSSAGDFDYDSIFKSSANNSNISSSKPSTAPAYGDIFDGLKSKSAASAVRFEEDENVFATISSPSTGKSRNQCNDLVGNLGRNEKVAERNMSSSVKGSSSTKGFDDLLAGFGSASSAASNRPTPESRWGSVPTAGSKHQNILNDPFVVMESDSTSTPHSSSGPFTDPLEEIGKFSKSRSAKAEVSSRGGGAFDDLDGRGKKDGSPSRSAMPQSATTREPMANSSFGYSETNTAKKDSADHLQEPPLFDAPNVSTNFQKSFVQTASPQHYETGPHVDMSPTSGQPHHQHDDLWLSVSEIPLFTQLTAAPPPSRPPPPIPRPSSGKKRDGFSPPSYFPQSSQSPKPDWPSDKSPPVSQFDDFTMGRSQNSFDASANPHSGVDTNPFAASANAMKDAMDKAEAKFRHAKEVRVREHAKAARNMDSGTMERDEVDKEEEKESSILKKERLRDIEREKDRQAVERATREARERAAVESRERQAAETRLKAGRAAVGKANAEARERAERTAVQRAQAEARERAAAEAKERAAANARERAAAASKVNQQTNNDDLESFFSMGRASSAPRDRTNSSFQNPFSDKQSPNKGGSEAAKRTPSASGATSSMKKPSSATNLVDDLSSIFGAAPSAGEFQDVEGETEERRRARLDRHQRTQERAAKALSEKYERDHQAQRDQEERHRIAETLDIEIKRWSAGKEGNLRALLSTMQYVLWPECGWQPVSLTDLITAASVKKFYRKATLCIHPDKVQQKGATLQQKYIAEKVFDLLKEAWNKLNSEELF